MPDNHDFNSFLSELSNSKLQKIIQDFDVKKQYTYQERLDYELAQIHATGFSSYFLIVADFIQWSKSNDVPVGPGRGSGAGSLVAFALGITALDPIEHNLLFERFINPERISMPDFDIDFCKDKRDRVIDYVSEKYGKDAVSQIATIGTMAARAVVRDVARALGKPWSLGDRISKMIPFEPGMTLEKAINNQPIFKKMIQDEGEVSEIIDLAFKLEGIARNVGKHAGGIVIAPGSIDDFCPTYFDPQSESVMTQFDKDDVEAIGLVKFDFLGLRTLTVIDRAVKTINEYLFNKNEEKLNLESLSLDDPKVFELLASGRTTAVFQLESTGMRELIRRLKPTKFEEIVGNRDAKHFARRLTERMLSYDFTAKKNPFQELGGFMPVFMGYGIPGTGKSMLIAAIATRLKEHCDNLDIPFLFHPMPDTLISTFQGGSAEKMVQWMKPLQDPSKIIFAPIDDAENNLQERTAQGVSAGVKEVIGVFLQKQFYMG